MNAKHARPGPTAGILVVRKRKAHLAGC
jgi:hypothetical protein